MASLFHVQGADVFQGTAQRSEPVAPANDFKPF